MTQSEKALLMTVPFRVSADQIGPAFTDDIKDQILGLRAKACEMARDRMGDLFVPFDPDTYAPGLTVLENAIYGKISGGAGAHTKEIEAIVANVLKESGLSRLSVEMIYDMPTELGGGNLPATYAERLAFCRAGIKRPDILIMDRALASYDHKTRQAASLALRKMMPETTFFFLEDKFEHPEDYDMYVEIQHGRVISKESGRADTDADDAPSADLTAKLRSLETAELFEGLDRKQLRLMAFGARWYTANAGEYIFRKGDEPTDGAYLLVDGEAGLYLPYEGHGDELISTVTTGRLVGDLALLTDETRFLDMRAHTDIKALRIGKEEFLAVVESDAATAFRLLQVVAGYLTVSATSRRREEESESDSAQDDG